VRHGRKSTEWRESPAQAVRVAVCGGGLAGAQDLELAEEVGRRLGEAGAVVICGGLGGVMEAVARGASEAGGLTIGILPGTSAADANRYIALPLATGMGEGRNVLVVRTADVVIAIGGEWGTLAEIALARKLGVPVVLLRPTRAAGWGLPEAASAEEAVGMALSLAGGPT
jgi:uncharacterized protein (TIGR00725 family)